MENISPASGSADAESPNPGDHNNGTFECNICLDASRDAVVTFCGHLFCWPCLHQWLETRPDRQTCPVCDAGVTRDRVIPLYGRGGGSTAQGDPRQGGVPPRPQGERLQPENRGRFQGFHDDGIQMSVGIGVFPFIGTSFSIGRRRSAAVPGTPRHLNLRLSLLFLLVGLTIMYCYIFLNHLNPLYLD